MEFMDVISKRRSVRKYKSDPVSKEDIDYICWRLNDIHILNRGSKFFWFKYTPESS